MTLPRYEAYRDVAVEAIDSVPTHWDLPPLYLRYEVLLGKMLDASRITGEHLVPYLRNVDVQWGQINYESLPLMDIAPNELDRYSIREGDLLVCEGGEVGRSAVVETFAGPIGFQKALHRLRPIRAGEVSKYMFYALRWAADGGVFSYNGQSTIAHLTGEQLRKHRLPCPSAAEQRAIAAFLDRETAKIDALISEQEKLIALLAEKRQATISHAVTKGLNPDAPMKDSGVPWLGEVPAHWEVRRLKSISPFITVGIVVNPSDYVAAEGLPFIYGGDISEGEIDIEGCRRISPESSATQPKTQLKAGDLLTVRVGAPGVTSVVPQSCEGGNCASVMLIRRGEFDSDWLCYAMNSRMVRYQVEVVQYGAAQEQFNIGHAINFWVATPPPPEQLAISRFLKGASAGVDRLMREAERAVQLLKERRSALIAAAVTGKIDVRGLSSAEAA